MSFFQGYFLKSNSPHMSPARGAYDRGRRPRPWAQARARPGPGPARARPGPGPARPGPGPGPGPAQKTNSKSIFLGICGISKASNRPVSIRLAELVCLLFFRGLTKPPGIKIDQKCSKKTENRQKSTNNIKNPRVLPFKTIHSI